MVLDDELSTATANANELNPVSTESSETVAATGDISVVNPEERKISKDQLKKKGQLEQQKARPEDRKVKRMEKTNERKRKA